VVCKNAIFSAKLALAMVLCSASVALAQTAPALGQAGGFAVLGASAVTNTGPTVVTGDLGIWPNTASSITGFPPGTVIGATHSGDAVAQQAQTDVTTAYNNLAGQACSPGNVLTGIDLGGLTLTPGVYCFSTSAQLTGTLTLDAQGNSAAVFVFQIGSTLTTASASRVLVINGGSSCNVFWQIGSSATLGTTTAFAGNILALASITLNTGVVAPGRVLARTGAVTLDSNGVGGCSSAGAVLPGSAALTPALSQWALIALTLLIAAVGFIAMRRADS
jgi:Ice-binding-like/IPTL-CTERM motif